MFHGSSAIPPPRLSFIVAVADNGVIGRDGALPWRLSSDLKTFRRLTMGKPLIMGRKTWQSLPGALDGRDNIVVTGARDFAASGAHVVSNLEEAMRVATRCAEARDVHEIMIIGGAAIFRELLPKADRLYWTQVDANPAGDVNFPPIDWAKWREVDRQPLSRGPRDEFPATLRVYDRIGP